MRHRTASTLLLAAAMVLSVIGCERLRAAARLRANQGMVLGSLIGAGVLTLIGSLSVRDSGLGGWIGGGAALGALAGRYIGYQFDPHPQASPPVQPAQTTSTASPY